MRRPTHTRLRNNSKKLYRNKTARPRQGHTGGGSYSAANAANNAICRTITQKPGKSPAFAVHSFGGTADRASLKNISAPSSKPGAISAAGNAAIVNRATQIGLLDKCTSAYWGTDPHMYFSRAQPYTHRDCRKDPFPYPGHRPPSFPPAWISQRRTARPVHAHQTSPSSA